MKAEIISIGDEILIGQVVNTNASWIGEQLTGIGIEVGRNIVIPDNREEILRALEDAGSRAELVIITGGIGPTKDDITKKVIASVLGRKMVSHKPTLIKIQKKLQKLTSQISKIDDRVALYPEGAEILDNPVGNAPGLIIHEENKIIMLLPGVPRELKAIMDKSAVSYLTKYKEKNYIVKQHILKTWGLPEAKIAEIIEDLMGENKNPLVGLRANIEGVKISIIAKGGNSAVAAKLIEDMENTIKQKLGDYIYATGETSMEKVVGMLLSINKKTISVAESITGGMITKKITDIPGSSGYFLSSMITYSNESKIRDLKIPADLIKENGAVSEQACKAMASSIRKISGSDIGLAATGIAGPSGGTSKKSVGLTFTGLAAGKECKVEKHQFSGTRAAIRIQTTQAALDMVRRQLTE